MQIGALYRRFEIQPELTTLTAPRNRDPILLISTAVTKEQSAMFDHFIEAPLDLPWEGVRWTGFQQHDDNIWARYGSSASPETAKPESASPLALRHPSAGTAGPGKGTSASRGRSPAGAELSPAGRGRELRLPTTLNP